MSIIRQLTDVLVLSAYHGPEMKEVLADVDLYQSVQADIRPMIGREFFGRPVSYPGTNPGPEPSVIRKGCSDVSTLLKVLKTTGIPVVP